MSHWLIRVLFFVKIPHRQCLRPACTEMHMVSYSFWVHCAQMLGKFKQLMVSWYVIHLTDSSQFHWFCWLQRDSISIMKEMWQMGGRPHAPHIVLSASADDSHSPKLSWITLSDPWIVQNRLYCPWCVTPPLGKSAKPATFPWLLTGFRWIVRRCGDPADKSSYSRWTGQCCAAWQYQPCHIECVESTGWPAGKAISSKKTTDILLDWIAIASLARGPVLKNPWSAYLGQMWHCQHYCPSHNIMIGNAFHFIL